MPPVIEIDSTAIELKPGIYWSELWFNFKTSFFLETDRFFFSVKLSSETVEVIDEKSKGLDVVDQGCVGCSTKDLRQIKDVSLSISSDDETDQGISLNMNKKSNTTSYKGKWFIKILI